MSYAIDTNVLARSIEAGHAMQDVSLDAIQILLRSGEMVYVLAQNLYKFWVIATRPQQQNGLGLNAIAAQSYLSQFEATFRLKADTPAVYSEWRRLVSKYSVSGKQAHDARIVAAMLVHNIAGLVTFNSRDFNRFQEISVIEPKDVIARQQKP